MLELGNHVSPPRYGALPGSQEYQVLILMVPDPTRNAVLLTASRQLETSSLNNLSIALTREDVMYGACAETKGSRGKGGNLDDIMTYLILP